MIDLLRKRVASRDGSPPVDIGFLRLPFQLEELEIREDLSWMEEKIRSNQIHVL
jgi:hypothetical protein